jgi:hypothetical protein
MMPLPENQALCDLMLKAPECGSQEPGYVLSWGDEAGWAGRW